MKKEVFNEDFNDEMLDEFGTEVALEDYVDEDELLQDAYIQHMIDQMEERALIEESEEEAMIDAAEEDRLLAEAEEQAVIDAFIEQQLIDQSLLDQYDEDEQIEYVEQQQLDENEQIVTDSFPKKQFSKSIADDGESDNEEETGEDQDDEPDESVPQNEAAHRQVKQRMMQRNHLDIYIKKEEISISCFGITRLKYKLNDNGWQWILNYLETGCYEDFGVTPSEVADIDSESRVKELIEQGSNIARIPSETEAYIEICAFFRYGKLFFSIRRNDEFMKYLTEKGL